MWSLRQSKAHTTSCLRNHLHMSLSFYWTTVTPFSQKRQLELRLHCCSGSHLCKSFQDLIYNHISSIYGNLLSLNIFSFRFPENQAKSHYPTLLITIIIVHYHGHYDFSSFFSCQIKKCSITHWFTCSFILRCNNLLRMFIRDLILF